MSCYTDYDILWLWHDLNRAEADRHRARQTGDRQAETRADLEIRACLYELDLYYRHISRR